MRKCKQMTSAETRLWPQTKALKSAKLANAFNSAILFLHVEARLLTSQEGNDTKRENQNKKNGSANSRKELNLPEL